MKFVICLFLFTAVYCICFIERLNCNKKGGLTLMVGVGYECIPVVFNNCSNTYRHIFKAWNHFIYSYKHAYILKANIVCKYNHDMDICRFLGACNISHT